MELNGAFCITLIPAAFLLLAIVLVGCAGCARRSATVTPEATSGEPQSEAARAGLFCSGLDLREEVVASGEDLPCNEAASGGFFCSGPLPEEVEEVRNPERPTKSHERLLTEIAINNPFSRTEADRHPSHSLGNKMLHVCNTTSGSPSSNEEFKDPQPETSSPEQNTESFSRGPGLTEHCNDHLWYDNDNKQSTLSVTSSDMSDLTVQQTLDGCSLEESDGSKEWVRKYRRTSVSGSLLSLPGSREMVQIEMCCDSGVVSPSMRGLSADPAVHPPGLDIDCNNATGNQKLHNGHYHTEDVDNNNVNGLLVLYESNANSSKKLSGHNFVKRSFSARTQKHPLLPKSQGLVYFPVCRQSLTASDDACLTGIPSGKFHAGSSLQSTSFCSPCGILRTNTIHIVGEDEATEKGYDHYSHSMPRVARIPVTRRVASVKSGECGLLIKSRWTGSYDGSFQF